MLKYCAALCLVLLAAGCSPPSVQGSLRVDTTPAGAELLIDGRLAGVTPHLEIGLVPGEYTVEVRLHGYEPWRGKATVAAGRIERLKVGLSPWGRLNLTLIPSAATAAIDGVAVTGLEVPLPQGQHLLEVTEGKRAWKGTCWVFNPRGQGAGILPDGVSIAVVNLTEGYTVLGYPFAGHLSAAYGVPAGWAPGGRACFLGDEVVLLDLDRLTADRLPLTVWDLSWSPDGKHLAAITSEGVVLYAADGTGPRLALSRQQAMVGLDGTISGLIWSPDSSRVACTVGQWYNRIFICPVAGRPYPVALELPYGTRGYPVAWSRAGRLILQVVNLRGPAGEMEIGEEGISWDLASVRTDGTGFLRLTAAVPGEYYMFSALAPSGNRVAFTLRRRDRRWGHAGDPERWDAGSVRTDAGGLVVYTNNGSSGGGVFTKDERHILGVSLTGDSLELRLWPAAGGAGRLVAQLPSLSGHDRPDAVLLASGDASRIWVLAPDCHWLVLKH